MIWNQAGFIGLIGQDLEMLPIKCKFKEGYASKLAIPAVGGTINILTNAAEFKKGGNVSSSIGNDGYTKYVASLSSGLSEKGFAATMQLTYNKGNGYIQGTDFKAYSYFLPLLTI